VFIGQTYHGASTQEIDIYGWYRDAMRRIREVTERPVLFRQHPRLFRTHYRRIADVARIKAAFRKLINWKISTEWRLATDLAKAHSVVVYSSNAGVLPVVLGIPTFVGDDISMAWDVNAGPLEKIEKPELKDRTRWANGLAYAQWNCREMANGECWAHFRGHAVKKK